MVATSFTPVNMGIRLTPTLINIKGEVMVPASFTLFAIADIRAIMDTMTSTVEKITRSSAA